MTRNLAAFEFGDTSIEVTPESNLKVGQTCDIDVRASGTSNVVIDSLSLRLQIHYKSENGFETEDVCRFDLIADGTLTDEPVRSWTKAVQIPRTIFGSLGTTVVTSRVEITTNRGRDSAERDTLVSPRDVTLSLFDQMVDFGFYPLKCTCVAGDGDTEFALQMLFDSRQTDFEAVPERVGVVLEPRDDGCSVSLVDGTVDDLKPDVSSRAVSDPIELRNDQVNHDLAARLLDSF